MLDPSRPLLGQEDCLVLNIYTPELPSENNPNPGKAVMFWIHGGGFFTGDGTTGFFGPEYAMDHDVVSECL